MVHDSVEVTVYCLAYNHEEYIKDALEGFANQITDFRYQVIVHDDASTDGTQQIIKEYCKKYPSIFVPVLQDSNKYSKGIRIVPTIIAPLIKGKYVAVCEGDDYWNDKYKLQKQYNVMEADPNCSACVHNTLFLDCITHRTKVQYSISINGYLSIKDVLLGGGNAFHTSSLFYRREFLDLPMGFYIPHVGDYPKAIWLALNGEIFYISDVMSVYRVNAKGSWSMKQSKETEIINTENSIKVLNSADVYSNYKYHSLIKRIIRMKKFHILALKKEYLEAICKYPDLALLKFKDKLSIYITGLIH